MTTTRRGCWKAGSEGEVTMTAIGGGKSHGVGHDEYWSNEQRNNVEAARAAGVHLAFFTANEVFWKTRWEPSIDGSNTAMRTLVCYKETKTSQVDPTSTWTGTWRDARFSPPSDGGRPENALLGNIFTVNGKRVDSLMVPAAYGKMRLWRGYFATAERRLEPLTALRSGVDGLNGVYLAANPGFPNSSYRASNYWVDVVFTP